MMFDNCGLCGTKKLASAGYNIPVGGLTYECCHECWKCYLHLQKQGIGPMAYVRLFPERVEAR